MDVGTQFPVAESQKLNRNVEEGVKQDVEEAEEAHFHRLYKSCAVMCRRAMQLGFMDKGVKDAPIGRMLHEAKEKSILSDEEAYQIGLAVSHYGGRGAHERENITESDARTAVVAAVKVLNDIYRDKQPASQ